MMMIIMMILSLSMENNGQVQRFVNLKIKYATVEQKLMVTVDRCEALNDNENDNNYVYTIF